MKSFQTKFRYALLCAGLLALLSISVFADSALNTVDSTGNVGQYTSLVLNSSGFPVISYFDQTNGDLKLAVCSDAACVAKTVTTVDSVGVVGQYTSVKLNSSGFPVVSYYDQTNGNLKVAICGNAICSSGNTLTTFDSTGDVGQYTSLELNSSGYPVISYFDVTNNDLNLAVCSDTACSTATLTNVDYIEAVGQYTSLKLNSSGFPVISYYDITNGDLKVAICSSPTCLNVNLTLVDWIDDVGQYTSLVLKSSDIPVISYYDLTNGNLKLDICSNSLCTIGTASTLDSSTGDVGQYTSLALNSSGYPVISYFDVANGDLKVLSCLNVDCAIPRNTTSLSSSTGSVGQYTSLALNSTGQFQFVSYYAAGTSDLALYTNLPINPWVTKIIRNSANPTSALTVEFRIGFSEGVSGVDAGDFSLTTTGTITGAGITNISGAGPDRIVTVNTGSGSGSIRLDIVDDDSIVDQNGPSLPLGGSGSGNGDFNSGEIYLVRPFKLFLPLIMR